MLRLITSVTAILATMVTAFAFDPQNFSGSESLVSTTSTWVNQRGSKMTISVDADGNVTGSYVNNASGTLCQGTPYPLVGRVDDNNIGFVVAWNNATENCNSVTAWGGYAQASATDIQIVTNWNIAYQNSSGSGSISQGSDTFTYQPTLQNSSLLAN